MATAKVEEHLTDMCEPCSKQNKSVEVTDWCTHCNENLCATCTVYHKSMKMSANHKVIPISDVTKEDLLLKELEIDEFCLTHKGKLITLVCKDHNQACCSICHAAEHFGCKFVSVNYHPFERIPQIEDDDINNLIADLDAIMTKDIDFNNTRSDDEKLVLSEASEFADKLRNHADKLSTMFETQIKSLFAEDKAQRVSRIERFRRLQRHLNLKLGDMETLDNFNPRQKVIFYLKLFSEATEVKGIIEKSKSTSESTHVPLLFKPNPMLCQILTATELGNVMENDRPSSPSNNSGDTSQSVTIHGTATGGAQVASKSKLNLMESGVKLIKKITKDNLKLGNTVWLYDGGFLPDGCLVMPDSKNSRILIFDSNFQLVSTHPTAKDPCGVCKMSGDIGVHVVCGRKQLLTYTLNSGWKETSRFDIGDEADGVGRIGDLIITGHDNKIVFRDKLSRSDGADITKRIDKGLTYISISNDGGSFYYRDGDNIVARKVKDREEIFRYSNSSLKNPRGISCDRNDNILVVGRDSKNVFQIQSNGSVGRVLLYNFNDITKPYAVCCSWMR